MGTYFSKLVSQWVPIFVILWFQYRGIFESSGLTPLPIWAPSPPPGTEWLFWVVPSLSRLG